MPICSQFIAALVAATPAQPNPPGIGASLGTAIMLMIIVVVLLGMLLLIVALLTARRTRLRHARPKSAPPKDSIDAWTESGRRLRPLDDRSERRSDG